MMTEALIDLRSDTVTRPCPAMRAAMAAAAVGDDVFGDDPTMHQLETRVAGLLGKEAALFATSGTQANLLALLTHCGRGDEYLVAQTAHTYLYEGGGAAALGGISPQPLPCEADGTLDLEKVAALIKPDDFHFARSRLLCLENTIHGRVLPLDYLPKARALADERGLALHLDGARIFHAAVRLGLPAGQIATPFDSVSVCLSKGLAAPVGSLLAGPAPFIRSARRWRKMLGGGLRQSGILAAAGLYALEHNIERLADDHANACRLAEALTAPETSPYRIDPAWLQTNMVFVHLRPGMDARGLTEFLASRQILILPGNPLRLVLHRDVPGDAIPRIAAAFLEFPH